MLYHEAVQAARRNAKGANQLENLLLPGVGHELCISCVESMARCGSESGGLAESVPQGCPEAVPVDPGA